MWVEAELRVVFPWSMSDIVLGNEDRMGRSHYDYLAYQSIVLVFNGTCEMIFFKQGRQILRL